MRHCGSDESARSIRLYDCALPASAPEPLRGIHMTPIA